MADGVKMNGEYCMLSCILYTIHKTLPSSRSDMKAIRIFLRHWDWENHPLFLLRSFLPSLKSLITLIHESTFTVDVSRPGSQSVLQVDGVGPLVFHNLG